MFTVSKKAFFPIPNINIGSQKDSVQPLVSSEVLIFHEIFTWLVFWLHFEVSNRMLFFALVSKECLTSVKADEAAFPSRVRFPFAYLPALPVYLLANHPYHPIRLVFVRKNRRVNVIELAIVKIRIDGMMLCSHLLYLGCYRMCSLGSTPPLVVVAATFLDDIADGIDPNPLEVHPAEILFPNTGSRREKTHCRLVGLHQKASLLFYLRLLQYDTQ